MRHTILGAAIAVASFASPASGDSIRTWVSGVGNDANPCSRTAPCKTFAGAIGKTSPGGEIDALDGDGFGAVTITKSITIDGGGQVASIIAPGTAGVVVAAGTNDRVVIRNLSINGTTTGVTGINFVSGGTLSVEHVYIANFSGNCINFQPQSNAWLELSGAELENCATGGVSISTAAQGGTRANIVRSTIKRSGVGVTAGANAAVLLFQSALLSNVVGGALANAATAQIMIDASSLSNNQGFGVQAANAAVVRISNSSVVYTNGTALLSVAGGAILTWSNNWFAGNVLDGVPNATIQPK